VTVEGVVLVVTAAAAAARARRWPAGLAWALWGLVLAGIGAFAWIDQLVRQAGRPDLVVATPEVVPPLLGAVGVATVGVVVSGRRPGHPVGWLLLGFGLSLSAAGVALAYTSYGVARAGTPPAAGLVALWLPATIVTAIACNAFVLLLTPAGALPSPRWRWWALVTAATPAVLLVVVTLMRPAGCGPPRPPASPLDLSVLEGGPLIAYQAAFAVVILANLAAAASLVARFRRARGSERQQLRWVMLGTVVVALLSLVNLAALALGAFALAPLVGGLNPLVLAAAVGAAILRYRLYDLDRIVSRTLAYGLLTVLLGGGYAATVLVLGQLFGAGERTPSWAVAGATLAAAALFRPARRRVQAVVDRRFNRRRYHAAQTVRAFSARLREQVDLDTISAELLAVVDQTVEPTRASFWTLPRPYQEAKTRAWPPEPSS
jgi:hypothetical protein